MEFITRAFKFKSHHHHRYIQIEDDGLCVCVSRLGRAAQYIAWRTWMAASRARAVGCAAPPHFTFKNILLSRQPVQAFDRNFPIPIRIFVQCVLAYFLSPRLCTEKKSGEFYCTPPPPQMQFVLIFSIFQMQSKYIIIRSSLLIVWPHLAIILYIILKYHFASEALKIFVFLLFLRWHPFLYGDNILF